MEEKQSTPEIDLSYFFAPVRKGLKMVRRGLLNYTGLIVSNGILFFTVVVLITGAAFSLRFVIDRSYKTDGIFLSRVLPGKYCAVLIDNLNQLKIKENVPLLARKLNTSPEVAATISDIEVSSVQDTIAIGGDTSTSVFTINLQVKNMQYIDSIQQGIVYYLENVPYALKRKEAKAHSLRILKTSIDDRLKNLDSLRKLVSQSIMPRSQGQGIILGEPINPVSIFQAEFAYFQEQLRMEEELKLIDNIEVVQPFQELNKPNNPSFKMIFVWGFLISLVATLIITPIFGKKPKASLT